MRTVLEIIAFVMICFGLIILCGWVITEYQGVEGDYARPKEVMREIHPGFNQFSISADGNQNRGYLRVEHPDFLPVEAIFIITAECRPRVDGQPQAKENP